MTVTGVPAKVVLSLMGVLALIGVVAFARDVTRGRTDPPTAQPARPVPGGPVFERVANPARTIARDARGSIIATFTDGARTVVLTGESRTFAEPRTTAATVTTTAWVRLAPHEWQAGAERADWFGAWFTAARSSEPDALEVGMQYVDGAPAESDKAGVRFRGDAQFGPEVPGEGRAEESDFYDYLGVPWKFSDKTRRPDHAHFGAVDCSGFVRLVYGYRLGYPLRADNAPGPGLPRRAFALAGHGVELVPNRQATATEYTALQPGDLLFFDTEGAQDQLDHTGIYLGTDSDGHHRFLSSRAMANGPTLGDLGGTSLLDDGGRYSRQWRAARRL
ncbi:NlpC/P60 family protein [Actinokineospora sp. HUAS TT18]|uniref:NlpC/P60 family protein n=1 Tax=Actinokineospora sp. HUAS TT18 TaxID=3447451 RepID=UPI003F5262A9